MSWRSTSIFVGVAFWAVLCAGCGPCGTAGPAATPTEGARLAAPGRVAAIATPEEEVLRGFRVRRGFLTMRDGVRLGVSYYSPSPRSPCERYPVVLAATPYRKDDDMLTTYYSLYSYFARRGIVVAQVDIRGSGASEGAVTDREYSDAELDDLEEAVAQLAAKPWSNGSVGMMGKSWAGFNAIMTAMRRPPALKAILVAHASEDLYRNDIHYIDGCLHYDLWALEMEAENLVPRFPRYELDAAYFRDRFDREPWTLAYMRHQRDGAWWQDGRSLKSDWNALDVPVYCIGALLDGYRDYVFGILDNARTTVWAEVGPWDHSWPHDGWPKPQYEWRRTAVRWWKRWLTGDGSWPFEGKTLTVFQRGASLPGANGWRTRGRFVAYDWPLEDTCSVELAPQADHSLAVVPTAGVAGSPPAPADHVLRCMPGGGVVVGSWWGDISGDMRSADSDSLVYDSAPVERPLPVLGSADVRLTASASVPVADWFVRLEDVWPDGRVSLVTGGGINGAQLLSTFAPAPLTPGESVDLRFPLHFTTYTFNPGHRIRVAVSNSLFPMIWPSAAAMTTTLSVGDPGTSIRLPVAPPAATVRMPKPVEPDPQAPGASWPRWVAAYWPEQRKVLRRGPGGMTAVSEREGGIQRIRAVRYGYWAKDVRWVDGHDPARAGFRGSAMQSVSADGRTVVVRATVRIVSDATHFRVTIRREVREDNVTVRARTWYDVIPRDFQ